MEIIETLSPWEFIRAQIEIRNLPDSHYEGLHRQFVSTLLEKREDEVIKKTEFISV